MVAARFSSVAITILGVLAVLVFRDFPTVYEAHGFFHSTLTPPLVVAVFLGIFWRKFTPAAVITSFLGDYIDDPGSQLSWYINCPILMNGIQMDPNHPYSYIRALYNLVVCLGVAVIAVFTTGLQKKIVSPLKHKRMLGSSCIF